MSTEPHTPTEQEQAIYDALYAGDHAAIEQMRVDAYAVGEGEQFDTDYYYAWTHYQADHEAPEPAREAATKVQVVQENTNAAAVRHGL